MFILNDIKKNLVGNISEPTMESCMIDKTKTRESKTLDFDKGHISVV